MKKLVLVSLLALIAPLLNGQLVVWDFDGISGTDPITSSPYATSPDGLGQITISNITNGSGITRLTQADGILYHNWTSSLSRETTDFIQFDVSVGSGYGMDFDTMTFDYVRSLQAGGGYGPISFGVFTSIDSFSSETQRGSTQSVADNSPTGTISFDMSSVANQTGTIGIRIYGWGAKNGNGELTFTSLNDTDIVLNGEVIPEPSTYALILGVLTVGVVLLKRRSLQKKTEVVG